MPCSATDASLLCRSTLIAENAIKRGKLKVVDAFNLLAASIPNQVYSLIA